MFICIFSYNNYNNSKYFFFLEVSCDNYHSDENSFELLVKDWFGRGAQRTKWDAWLLWVLIYLYYFII